MEKSLLWGRYGYLFGIIQMNVKINWGIFGSHTIIDIHVLSDRMYKKGYLLHLRDTLNMHKYSKNFLVGHNRDKYLPRNLPCVYDFTVSKMKFNSEQ